MAIIGTANVVKLVLLGEAQTLLYKLYRHYTV